MKNEMKQNSPVFACQIVFDTNVILNINNSSQHLKILLWKALWERLISNNFDNEYPKIVAHFIVTFWNIKERCL